MVDVTDPTAGLDFIAWDELNHAYGAATDVPGDLRAICSTDAAARDTAFSNLFASIFTKELATQPPHTPYLSLPRSRLPARLRRASTRSGS